MSDMNDGNEPSRALTEEVAAMTHRLLVDAGVGTGMRVLDIGCGHGDVTLLAARLVGSSGSVVGVDRSAAPLATARERAREAGFANVAFVEGDLDALSPDLGVFDAVVGRRVLMYLPDPARTLRRLADVLRIGGLMAFQESDATMTPAFSPSVSLPLHRRVHGWIWETVAREGANIHLGFDLARLLAQAGVEVEQTRAEAIVQTPTRHHAVGAIVRAMLPRIVAHDVATEAEIDVETLDDRLIAERRLTNATYVGDMVFTIWGRKR